MVEDTRRRRQDDNTETTGREEQVNPRLNLSHLHVITGRDDTRLVQTAIQLNDDLASTVIVNDLELANVACQLDSLVRVEGQRKEHLNEGKGCNAEE